MTSRHSVKQLWWKVRARNEARRAVSIWDELDDYEDHKDMYQVMTELQVETAVAKHRRANDRYAFVLPLLVGVILGMLVVIVIALAAYAW